MTGVTMKDTNEEFVETVHLSWIQLKKIQRNWIQNFSQEENPSTYDSGKEATDKLQQ